MPKSKRNLPSQSNILSVNTNTSYKTTRKPPLAANEKFLGNLVFTSKRPNDIKQSIKSLKSSNKTNLKYRNSNLRLLSPNINGVSKNRNSNQKSQIVTFPSIRQS